MAWPIRKLGEICEILDSQRKPITKRDRKVGPYPYYGATGVLDYVADFIFDENLVLIGEDGAKWGAGDNSAFKVSGKIWVNNHAHVLKSNSDIVLDDWLVYYLNFKDLTGHVSGMTVPKLNQGQLKQILIPIPPLREQNRIVEMLDDAFADIEKARELTEQNLKNARELFESYLRVVFEATSKFPKKAWKDALDIRSGRNQKEVEAPDGAYPIVGSAGKTMGFANTYICEAGTTILGRKGTINNPIYMEQAFWNVDTAFGLHAGENLDKKFLYYFCKSFDFTTRDKGSGRPSLVKKDLLEMKMPLPPLEVQRQITLKLESLELEKLKLAAIYKEKHRKIEQLRYALLANIFNDC